MSMNPGRERPIDQVRSGMHVIDADGDEIGTVKDVVMGDAEAATSPDTPPSDEPEALVFGAPGVTLPVAVPLGTLGGVFGDEMTSDLPGVERARLLRAGYVLVDLKGIFSGKKFAAADDIADVEGDVVHLGVSSNQLVG
ncbi:MAG TPA: hypothetical protein VGC04_04130 [Cellulomonas sp.]